MSAGAGDEGAWWEQDLASYQESKAGQCRQSAQVESGRGEGGPSSPVSSRRQSGRKQFATLTPGAMEAALAASRRSSPSSPPSSPHPAAATSSSNAESKESGSGEGSGGGSDLGGNIGLPAATLRGVFSSLTSIDALLGLELETGFKPENVSALFVQLRKHSAAIRKCLMADSWQLLGGDTVRETRRSSWRPPLPPGPRPDSLSISSTSSNTTPAVAAKQVPKSDIDVLLRDDPMIKWDFDNETVMTYRASASRSERAPTAEDAVLVPSFKSTRPLVEGDKSVVCTVRISPEIETSESMTQTRVAVSADDTAQQVLERVLKKFRPQNDAAPRDSESSGPVDYTLKAYGLDEFFEPDRPVLQSLYVRSRLRYGLPVEILLTVLPPPSEDPEVDADTTYKKWVDPQLRPLSGTGSPENQRLLQLAETAQTTSEGDRWLNPATRHDPLSLRSLGQQPFELKVLGATGCSTRSFPVLVDAAYDQLYVKTFLFHGLTILSKSIRVSHAVPLTSGPRWGASLAARNPSNEVAFANLPRETRIAVLLVGASSDGLHSRVLGWSSSLLINEYGHFAQGRKELPLWPCAEDVRDRASDIQIALALAGLGARGAGGGSAAPVSAALQEPASPSSPQSPASPVNPLSALDMIAGRPARQSLEGTSSPRSPKGRRGSVLPMANLDRLPADVGPADDLATVLQAAADAAPVDFDSVRDDPEDDTDGDMAESLRFVLTGTTRSNLTVPALASGASSSAAPCRLVLEFKKYATPVTAPLVLPAPAEAAALSKELPSKVVNRQLKSKVEELSKADALYRLSYDDKVILWQGRHGLVESPGALPRFLDSVDWSRPARVAEVHRLLPLWKLPASPVAALELLGPRYADHGVREYAADLIDRLMSNEQLCIYMLQLAQCLRHEPYHDSPLTRVLMRRSLAAPLQVGHALFWSLRSALHEPSLTERFTMILEEFLSYCPDYASELRKQYVIVKKLQAISEMVASLRHSAELTGAEITARCHEALLQLNEQVLVPEGSFHVPLDPRLQAQRLIVSKCRFMTSKKVPLWLEFQNADKDGDDIKLIFKSGDDLRQDMLTLQLLRVMDDLWLQAGLDLRLKVYGCVATGVNGEGEGVGMIEVVRNAETKGGIQRDYGGRTGAFKDDVILSYLQAHNKSAPELEKAQENFMRSCAGFCVATYVLGLADRHSDNIMVTRDGHLFHIDFGHFLGNFKTKFGIKRERENFVFTPAMAYVMGGKQFKDDPRFRTFVRLCLDAYLALRRNSHVFVNLFVLMVSAGMPELMSDGDVQYLKDKLALQLSDSDAERQFKEEIDRSLETTWRRVDDFIHDNRFLRNDAS